MSIPMAYTHLLDIYRLIDDRLAQDIPKDAPCTGDAACRDAFEKGRTDLLTDFRNFLSEHLDHKLPKRIRKRLSSG